MTLVRAAIPLALILALVACSGPSGAATSTSLPTGTAPDDGATALQASPPAPTPTAVPPTATTTSTALPPATASATATRTPAIEPAATGTPAAETETLTSQAASPDGDARAGSKRASPAARLAEDVEALLDEREGLYEVVVIDPDGETVFSLNADEQLQAASLYKLLIMVEIYRQIEEEIIELDDEVFMYGGFFKEAGYDDPFDPSYIGSTLTVEQLLRPMVALSSNVAGFALLHVAGNENINATAASLGLTASEIRWMPALRGSSTDEALASYAWLQPEATSVSVEDAYNVTCAADVALLLRLLVDGRVVSPEASEDMLQLLAAQVVNDRLPALLPDDVVVAHKTGNIDNVIHDAGVIYTSSGPAVVVVLTAGAPEWQAVEFMRELALLVYQSAVP
jgi:beta-lactamase class A